MRTGRTRKGLQCREKVPDAVGAEHLVLLGKPAERSGEDLRNRESRGC